MTCKYKVKIKDIQYNYKVQMTDIQSKYKFKVFCTGYDDSEIKEKIDAMYQAWPKVSGEGETITLNDTVNTTMAIDLKGNTSQETSILPSEYTQVDYIRSTGGSYIDTGINADTNLRTILDISFINPTSANQTMGAINIGTPNKRYHLLSAPNSISFWVNDTPYNIIDLTSTDRHLWDLNVPEGKVVLDNTTTTIPTNIDDTELNFWLFGRNSNATQYKGAFKLWACKMYYNGTLVRDFIPCYRNSDNEVGLYDLLNGVFYTNQGTGAFTYGSTVNIPNPDYPQTITNVTGTNTIKINGKNLLDESSLETGGIDESTGQNIYNQYRKRSDYISIDSNTTYSLSCLASSGIWLIFYHYDKNKEFISSNPVNASNGIASDITPNNCIFIRVVIGNTASLTATNIQLEISSTATTYEAYKEQNYTINLEDIELCKIGDYQDRIYPLNGKWYLEKKIGKVVLDGTQTINQINTTQTNTTRVMYQNFVQGKSSSIDLYCSHLAGAINWNVDTEGMYINNTDLVFRMNKTTIGTTIAEINNWLSNNNVTLEYALATPTTEEITDSTLISQLEKIKEAESYSGQTNISQTNDDKPFILTAKALKDLSSL